MIRRLPPQEASREKYVQIPLPTKEDVPSQCTHIYIHIQKKEEATENEQRPQITENTVLESEHVCYDACVLIYMHVHARSQINRK